MTKRDEILITALKLFSHHGYAGVGIDRIIAESGVAKMTLYKQFGTKEGLIEATLKLRDELFMADLSSYVGQHASGAEKIRAIFEWHRRWFKAPDFNGCIFIKASEEFGDSVPAFTAIMRNHKLAIQDLVRRCLSEMGARDIEQHTALIFICIEGLTIQANMFKTDDFTTTVMDSVLTLIQQAPALCLKHL